MYLKVKLNQMWNSVEKTSWIGEPWLVADVAIESRIICQMNATLYVTILDNLVIPSFDLFVQLTTNVVSTGQWSKMNIISQRLVT